MSNKIKHEFTEHVVCPYCGWIHLDIDDLYGDSGKIECEKCGEKFTWERFTYIDYSTQKLDK